MILFSHRLQTCMRFSFEGLMLVKSRYVLLVNVPPSSAISFNRKNISLQQSALHGCVSHLDDLEAWLEVFNVKLSNMRQDIHAIEVRVVFPSSNACCFSLKKRTSQRGQRCTNLTCHASMLQARNNDLETSSRNNGVLIEVRHTRCHFH